MTNVETYLRRIDIMLSALLKLELARFGAESTRASHPLVVSLFSQAATQSDELLAKLPERPPAMSQPLGPSG